MVLSTEDTGSSGLGNITVDAGAPITWISAATLTMSAAGGIIIDAAITNTATPTSPYFGTLILNAPAREG